MKKIILLMLVAMLYTSVEAQVIEIYENDATTPVATYKNSDSKKYSIVISENTDTCKAPKVSLNKSKDTIKVGESVTLIPTILNSSNSIAWTSSDSTIASVSNGVVSGLVEGTATIYCFLVDTDAKDSCIIYVDTKYDYVDLGLPSGTLWATYNAGADKPEEYGYYFAWGETKSKTTYSLSNYTHYSGGYTKYNTRESYGKVDNKTVLESVDDAATVNWGGKWRMPTVDEFKELINSDYTSTEWTKKNDVNGYLITSRINKKSIFLPTPGSKKDGTLRDNGSYGYYWSSSLCVGNSQYAYTLDFGPTQIVTNYDGTRYLGQSIRPVRSK